MDWRWLVLDFTFKDERRKESECRKSSAWCMVVSLTEMQNLRANFGVGGKGYVKRKLISSNLNILIYRSQWDIQEGLFQLTDEYYILELQSDIWPGDPGFGSEQPM